MPKEETVFKRIEKKYLISQSQYDEIICTIKNHTCADEHGETRVYSLYMDTPDHLLIRRSLQKPLYKEKLRLRSYGYPEGDSRVFVEIKKKCRRVVYKRRIELPLHEAAELIRNRELPGEKYSSEERQILDEISWMLKRYGNLTPAMVISCDRMAYYALDDDNLRITFDRQILWKDVHRMNEEDCLDRALLPEGMLVMEIKTADAMPLWLVDLLSMNDIYPTSFSKYGRAYEQELMEVKYA